MDAALVAGLTVRTALPLRTTHPYEERRTPPRNAPFLEGVSLTNPFTVGSRRAGTLPVPDLPSTG